MGRVLVVALVVWLAIGAYAAYDRGYFGDNEYVNCSQAGHTALTVVAGPLNYLGVNTRVSCETPPQG